MEDKIVTVCSIAGNSMTNKAKILIFFRDVISLPRSSFYIIN